jgi:hypothetical protein
MEKKLRLWTEGFFLPSAVGGIYVRGLAVEAEEFLPSAKGEPRRSVRTGARTVLPPVR